MRKYYHDKQNDVSLKYRINPIRNHSNQLVYKREDATVDFILEDDENVSEGTTKPLFQNGGELNRCRSHHFIMNRIIKNFRIQCNGHLASRDELGDDRRNLLRSCGVFLGSVCVNYNVLGAKAFEGGIGGLGKTKPNTGITFWNYDILPSYVNQIVSAEIEVQQKPVIISFYSPWPLLTTSNGLETRDPLYPESIFVQVIDNPDRLVLSKLTTADVTNLLLQTVFSQQGKFGAYAAPIDVKVKLLNNDNNNQQNNMMTTCSITFTTFTPGLRESDRQLYISFKQPFPNCFVLLITGTTRQRFTSQKQTFQNIINSFEVIPAPLTTTRKPKTISTDI